MDKRSQRTIKNIKKSFLNLLKDENYLQITVSQICKISNITRTTFYSYFNNLNDLLNEIINDAIFNKKDNYQFNQKYSFEEIKNNNSLLPMCQRLCDSNKYRCLFMDPTLSEYIINKIIVHEQNKIIPKIKNKTRLTETDAKLLFKYQVYGSFMINKKHKFIKNSSWYHDLEILNKFAEGGYNQFTK